MSQDPQEMLILHGDKAALGIAVLVAAFFGFTSVTGTDAGKTSDEIDRLSTTIKKKQEQEIPEDAVPPVSDPMDKIKKAWGTVKLERSATPLHWTFYRVPKVTVRRMTGPEPVVVTNPSGLTAETSRRTITLNWSAPPTRGPEPGAPTEMRQAATLLGYVLHKWKKGEMGKVERFAFDKDTTSHADAKFEPKTTYCYKVVAYFELERTGEKNKVPQVLGGTPRKIDIGDHKDQQVRFSKPTQEVCVTTAVNIFLQFERRFVKQGIFWVWQYWKGGKWWVVEFRPEEGQDIGGVVTAGQLMSSNSKNDEVKGTPEWEALEADRKKTFPWSSGYAYLGEVREKDEEGKRQDYAYVEQRDVPMAGLGGIDWGSTVIRIKKSKKGRPAELENSPDSGGGGDKPDDGGGKAPDGAEDK